MSRWLTLVALLAAAVAPVLGTQAGAASGTARVVLLSLTGLAAATGVGIATLQRLEAQGRQQEAESAAEEARDEFALLVGGALSPTSHYLARLSAATGEGERQTLLGQLIQATLVAAVSTGVPGSRSALYLADEPGRSLVRAGWSGRSGEPRTAFEEGSGEGDSVLALVRRGNAVLVPDVAEHPTLAPSVPGAYGSVVAVAVTAGPRRFGLLTADAPGRGALSGVELEFVRVLANLLGAGLAQVGGVPSLTGEETP